MEKYESTKITYIYGLYEVGKEDKIRYVGKSDNPKNRLRSHISYIFKEHTHKSCWMRSVIESGGKIGLKIIEVVDYYNWSEREIYWISNFKNLTNTSPGGESGITGKLFRIEYDECKKWINDNYPNIKRQKDFRNIINQLPDFIPKSPNTVFKDCGWSNWQSFLNSDYVSSKDKNKKILPYDECKKWLSNNFGVITKWSKIINDLPEFIPKRPYIAYKKSGWCGWVDFLGRDLSPIKYIEYNHAKEYVQKLNLNSSREWHEYWKRNHEYPDFPLVPKSPNTVYAEWETWTIFLNSNQKSIDLYKNKLSFHELKEYIKKNMSNISTSREYKKYVKDNNLVNIPICPNRVYKDYWVSWNSFLGNVKFTKERNFKTFEECKEIIKENNIKSNKEYKILAKNIKGLPKSPDAFFKNEWTNWYDFLGK
jgi:hypothetical protein